MGKNGYIVLSTSNYVDIIKMSIVQKLTPKFYETNRSWYGSEIIINSYFNHNPKKIKQRFQRIFQKYAITPSLFKKEMFHDYIEFLTKAELQLQDTQNDIQEKMECMDIN